MSQIEKLKALQESKSKTANLSVFDNIVVIDVGIKPTRHYPKLKDEFGNTFTEFGTGKIVKIVLPQERKFELLGSYKVVGLGYDIKAANMIFIEQRAQIAEY